MIVSKSMGNSIKAVLTLFALCVLSACSTSQVGSLYKTSWSSSEKQRDLFVTIDGTSNTQLSRTNAARLFEIVDAHSGQGERELATYYAEGVGSGGNVLGLAGGYGMSDDIRNAYAFLTAHYRPGDRIFLSGFSRGAYGVRALGGMIATAGIPDLSKTKPSQRKKIVSKIFGAYKTNPQKGETRQQHFDRRVRRVRSAMNEMGVAPRGMANETRIEALAVWDTVEALGLPDRTEEPDEDVGYYLLTNCNVNNVFHAMALDDNRAHSFTPIFADAEHMYATCEKNQSGSKVEEVWFAGAHSDVGGTYAVDDAINGHLSGVSLNWMLDKLSGYRLYSPGQRVFEDPFGPIHDARAFSPVYKGLTRKFRDPIAYHAQAVITPRPTIHASAIARLAIAKSLNEVHPQCEPGADLKPKLICTDDLSEYGLVAELRAAGCLDDDESFGFRLREGHACIDTVGKIPDRWPNVPGKLQPGR